MTLSVCRAVHLDITVTREGEEKKTILLLGFVLHLILMFLSSSNCDKRDLSKPNEIKKTKE
jgi:hypothetical protein